MIIRHIEGILPNNQCIGNYTGECALKCGVGLACYLVSKGGYKLISQVNNRVELMKINSSGCN